MRVLLAAVIALSVSCGPGSGSGRCCLNTMAKRGFGYVGTYAVDGGASTQVQLIVGADGIASITFARGGDQVVEQFQTSTP